VSVVDIGLLAKLQHTADELVPDGVRVEVLDGLLVMNPPASLPHTVLTDRLGAQLAERAPAELTVTVAGAGIYERDDPQAEYQQPDITVYRRPSDPRAVRLVARDVELIGEVVSPANRRHQHYEAAVVERAARYGIPWVVIADPDAATLRWWHDGTEQATGPAWTNGTTL
jgi:hypothetical protein